MKLMKRLAAVVLGVALLCPMTAYAAQSQEHDGYERLLRFQDEDVRQPV